MYVRQAIELRVLLLLLLLLLLFLRYVNYDDVIVAEISSTRQLN